MPLPSIEFYSDVHCPWAYTALFRLRKIWPEYEGRVRIRFRSLSLELKNQKSITPAICPGGDCLQPFRDMLQETLATVTPAV